VSLYATLYTHYNAFNFLSISKKKQMNQKKQKRNVYLKLEFCCIQSSMCKKTRINLIFGRKRKRERETKVSTRFLHVCVCQLGYKKAFKREREKSFNSIFDCFVCVYVCVCVCVQV
jgi:hypothetical protein